MDEHEQSRRLSELAIAIPEAVACGLARSSSVASAEAANHGSVTLPGWRSMPVCGADVLRGPDAYPVAL